MCTLNDLYDNRPQTHVCPLVNLFTLFHLFSPIELNSIQGLSWDLGEVHSFKAKSNKT